MKQFATLSVLAAAALGAQAQSSALPPPVTAPQADSSVTVYGIIDAATVRVTGITGGTSHQLVSGMMDGSRLGFRGNENLGGGFRAIFTLESRLEIDTGGTTNRPVSGSQLPDFASQAARLGLPNALQPAVSGVAKSIGDTIGVNLRNAFWDRQAWVGLVTPVGAIIAGHQYTPGYELHARLDTMFTQSALAAGQVSSLPAGIDIRRSNAISYRVEKSGFIGSAMVSVGEGSTDTGRMFGGMVYYKGHGFSAGAGYNERKNELRAKGLRSLVAGVSKDIGPGEVFFQFIQVKDNNPAGLSRIAATLTPAVGAGLANLVQGAFINALRQDARVFHVGYKLTAGPNTFYVAYNNKNDTRATNADTASFGAVYSYALSKRTDINLAAVRFNNTNNGQLAPGSTGFFGGVTRAAGVDSTSLALGMRHRF